MARIYIPAGNELHRALRGFGAPNTKPPSPVIFDPTARLSKNLKASYFFDYSARDYVAGNHGTVTGTASYTTTSRGPGIDFAGPSGNPSVDIPSIQTIIGAPNFTNDSFSLSALVKADSVSTRAGIFSQGHPGGNTGVYLYFETSGKVDFSVNVWNTNIGSANLTATDWNFITATYNASTDALKVYVNGVEGGTTGTNSSPATDESNPKVGDIFESFSRGLNGQVLCFHVHKGALTAEEARRFYLDQWQVYQSANQSPILIGTAAAGGGVIGDLAAQESGSDTAAITGTVLVEGDLSAQESAADTAALTGTVTVQGTLSAQESGSDTAAFTGSMAISGDLAAVEIGSDTAGFTGSVLVAGTLSVQEVGSDTALILGTEPSEITGDLVVQESGSDTAAITGQVHVSGTLSAQESGSDSMLITGGIGDIPISGNLVVQETGTDACVVLGSVLVVGSMSVQESESDDATITGSVLITGSLSAQESGGDTAAFTGGSVVTGTLAVQETGADTAYFSSEEPDISGNLVVQESGADKASILGLIPACTRMSTYDAAQAKLNAALIDVFGESVMFDPTGYQYPVTAIFEVTGPENSGSRSRDVQDIGNTESYRPRPYLMMRTSDVEDLDIKARQTVIVRGKNMTVVSDPVNDGQCMTMVYVRGDF